MPKSRLQPPLELLEEPAMFGLGRDMNEHRDRVIAVRFAFVRPEVAHHLTPTFLSARTASGAGAADTATANRRVSIGQPLKYPVTSTLHPTARPDD
jgi:hypothetical protein